MPDSLAALRSPRAANQGFAKTRAERTSAAAVVWSDVWLRRRGQWQIVQAQDEAIAPGESARRAIADTLSEISIGYAHSRINGPRRSWLGWSRSSGCRAVIYAVCGGQRDDRAPSA
jgi:hypothetical protein